jgi:hypothetical protein
MNSEEFANLQKLKEKIDRVPLFAHNFGTDIDELLANPILPLSSEACAKICTMIEQMKGLMAMRGQIGQIGTFNNRCNLTRSILDSLQKCSRHIDQPKEFEIAWIATLAAMMLFTNQVMQDAKSSKSTSTPNENNNHQA